MPASRFLAVLLLSTALSTALSAAHAEPPRPYAYKVVEHKVIDGDTLRTKLDLGFGIQVEKLARLYGVDAPESNTAAGIAVAQFAKAWCERQQKLVAVSLSAGKYADRYVAELHGDKGTLADALLKHKLARVYTGGKRPEWSDDELARISAAARKAVGRLRSADPVEDLGDDAALLGSGQPPGRTMVWVTDSGEKYHTKDCRFCDHSGRPVELQAVLSAGMEACKVCKPPRE